MGLLDWLFGRKIQETPHKRIRFTFLELDENENENRIPINAWFQKSLWKDKNFVGYCGTWSSDWKLSEENRDKVKVAGISRENRSEDFLRLACLDDFKMYLEDESDNPVDKNARKVMVSATVNGELISKHIGYLPIEISKKYAGAELDIRPAFAFLPTKYEHNLGVKVELLVRSARYLKKKAKLSSP